jgi:o-succinylbenzoate synthase
MKVDFSAFELATARPLKTAHGVIASRPAWTVTVRAGDGVGRGEAAPLPAFGTESAEATVAALSAFELTHLPRSLDEVTEALAGLEATPAARCGLECALLELLARGKGVRVAELLAERVAPEVKVGALLDGETAAELARAAERAVADGFSCVKVKVAARPLPVDAQRLHAVRSAIGPRVALRVDANGGWSEGEARTALRGLESLELELCEQPVAAGDVEALRRLRRQVPVRLAADEALLEPGGVARVLVADPEPAAQVLVLKPMALGGVLPALEAARCAAAAGVDVYVTSLIDGPIARAAALHLSAVVPSSGSLAHGLATGGLLKDSGPAALAPERGVIRLPEGPGWGLG